MLILHRHKVMLAVAAGALSAAVVTGGVIAVVSAQHPSVHKATASASLDEYAAHLSGLGSPVAAELNAAADAVDEELSGWQVRQAVTEARNAAAALASVHGSTKSAMRDGFEARMARATEVSATLAVIADEERARIAEAANRAAAEEAARAAAERSIREGSASSRPTPSAPTQTGPDRLPALAASLGLPLPPVVLGTCPASGHSAGCYVLGSGRIVISEFAMTMQDCKVKHIIAHEYRHYWQEQNGRFAVNPDGSIANVVELEADANAFADQYGCR